MNRTLQYSPFFFIILCTASFLFSSCSSEDEKQFTLLSPSETNIDFRNDVTSTRDFNIVNYMYFYDGAGVAAGDVNKDGLPDLFFVSNEGPNKLYVNKGEYRFVDVSEEAGIQGREGGWSTGVTMADVNGNGYLDIYVSRVNYLNKEGPNELFINNGDGTFTERAAEYGIDFTGYSTQSVFFDYNKNGRLDLFILNHSFHSEKTYGQAEALREIQDPNAGDRLFRNDGDRFTDVTEEAGIRSSAVGYGLGVAVSDINLDGHPDIYVGNDFHEDDYLYINNGDGTFTESLYSMIGHTSNSSMGNDIADITNNGYPDIVSLDMMPDDHNSFIRSGGADLPVIAGAKANFGFGPKASHNTLQVNRGFTPEGTPFFSEMAFTMGVARTDWSWAALFADLDNSGYKDLFVTNGMVRRPNDLDYIRRVGNFRERSTEGRVSEEEFESIQYMPPIFIPNYLYKNHGALGFEDMTESAGVDQPTYSSGAVFVDLNQSGMLDLVVSNVDMPSYIYKNNSLPDSTTNYLKIVLKGESGNTTGIGSKLILYSGEELFYQEQMPTRGFQSSVDHMLHFGLGEIRQLDSLLVIWPDDRYEMKYNISSNQKITVNQSDAADEFDYSKLHHKSESPFFENITSELSDLIVHRDNNYDDFSQEPLMPYYLSREGPAIAIGDVTGNGFDDIFLGNGHQSASVLYLQSEDGRFQPSGEELFSRDYLYEDVDAVFFDANGNGLQDLYVVSGGGQLFQTREAFRDRLYINLGDGEFRLAEASLPNILTNGSVVKVSDFNGDGSRDLFVGGRSMPWRYGLSPKSALLLNDGDGNFENVTQQIAPDLEEIGMVTDAVWADFTGNGFEDLIIAGEWMPIAVFENKGGNFENITSELGLGRYSGLWQTIRAADMTGDGNLDLIAGNFGTNSRMTASESDPLSLYINDFNDSGYTSGILSKQIDGVQKPFEQFDELAQEFPNLSQKINSYADFASKSLSALFGKDKIDEAIIKQVTELQSVLFLNRGGGPLQAQPLPIVAQSFPVKAIELIEDEQSGIHLLLGGNYYNVKPSIGGRQDAGYGLHLTYSKENGLDVMNHQESGFFVRGEIRTIHTVQVGENTCYLVGLNNGRMEMFMRR